MQQRFHQAVFKCHGMQQQGQKVIEWQSQMPHKILQASIILMIKQLQHQLHIMD
jgi:hypothetical protein